MVNFKSVLITFISIALFSCTDDIPPEPEVVAEFKSINAANTEDAFSKSINDTFTIIGNINTQTVIGGKEYDLNDDGISDLSIRYAGGGGGSAWGMSAFILPLDSNEVVIQTCKDLNDKDYFSPVGITSNSTINAESNFMKYTGFEDGFEATYKSHNGETNCWGNSEFKYVGVKILSENVVTYAWVKLAIELRDNETQIIVDSFASRK